MTSSFFLALSFFAFSCPLTSMADKYDHNGPDGESPSLCSFQSYSLAHSRVITLRLILKRSFIPPC